MADFAGRWVVSQTAAFQQRVCIAAMTVAVQYTNETGETVVVDQKRRALAAEFFADPVGNMVRFAVALASQDVTAADPDAVIEQKVYDLWDGMAGIYGDEYDNT